MKCTTRPWAVTVPNGHQMKPDRVRDAESKGSRAASATAPCSAYASVADYIEVTTTHAAALREEGGAPVGIIGIF
jgi:hypothetical protein